MSVISTTQQRINREIRAREVRVIDNEGNQLGVLSLNDAIQAAWDRDLDLVEVAPTAVPPVCRILDFGKFKYSQAKKTQESKKHQRICGNASRSDCSTRLMALTRSRSPVPLKKLWSVKISGGYAGPAVVGERVYVTDYVRNSGESKNSPNAPAKSEGKERVLCLNAKTGAEMWKHEYDVKYEVSYPAGPRCTPTVMDGKLYALGSMGNLHVLDATKGTPLWSKDFKVDYKAKTPMWGFTGHPLVYKNMVICLVGGAFGVLLATGGAALITAQSPLEVLISTKSMIIAFGFASFIGIFFGLYPARRASRLLPVDCLRYE